MPKDKIEKAIQLEELERDLADLRRQALTLSGAMQYIQQKIASLTKHETAPTETAKHE